MRRIVIILSILLVSCEVYTTSKTDASVEEDLKINTYKPSYIGDLCKPCKTNRDCNNGVCVINLITGETFCSLKCKKRCPNGFVCMPNFYLPEMNQCLPLNPDIPCKEV